MRKIVLTAGLLVFFMNFANTQTYFRSGIFLHHSTGQYIWGPNPDGTSTTTIPDQMHLFNVNHSLTGSDSVSLNEEWWSPGDNEWSTQHEFFDGNTAFTDINAYLAANKILVVKSCFPSSEIDSWGTPADTADPTYKSVYNYKWHWRHIIKVMENHPDNFFAIWTNAPLETNSTNTTQADLALKFCTWAKDTLAAGLDPVYGAFPHNVYVFDYFNKIAGTDGIEPVMYATSSGDSHPNGTATDFIAPQFVDEIFSAALAYEQYLTGLMEHSDVNFVSCFPDPFQTQITFKYKIVQPSNIALYIFDVKGRKVHTMFKDTVAPGEHNDEIDLSKLKKGIYYYNFSINQTVFNGKIVKQ